MEFRKNKDSNDVFYSSKKNFELRMDSPRTYAEYDSNNFNGKVYIRISVESSDVCIYDLISLEVYDENRKLIEFDQIDLENDGSAVANKVNLEYALGKYEFDTIYFVCNDKIKTSSVIYLNYKIKIYFGDELLDYWDENVELHKCLIKVDKHFLI